MYSQNIHAKPKISFEFFPAKNDLQMQSFRDSIDRLGAYQPRFVSVTYGAGGSDQDRSFDALDMVKTRLAQQKAATQIVGHLTCVGAMRGQSDQQIARMASMGLDGILALRGDPPGGVTQKYLPTPGGYRDAADLSAAVASQTELDIYVSAYPEMHPQSGTWDVELDTLRRKVDAGATEALTQFFFDPDLFLKFQDRVADAGIDIKITPGILPISNLPAIRRFANKCGADVPAWLDEKFQGLAPDSEMATMVGTSLAADLMMSLLQNGVERFHIYTLNRWKMPSALCQLMGHSVSPNKTAA